MAETIVLFKIHNTLLCIKSKELKVSDFPDNLSSNKQSDCYFTNSQMASRQIDKIKEEILKKNMLDANDDVKEKMIKNDEITNKIIVEIDKIYQTTANLTPIQEENLKNLNQSNIRRKLINQRFPFDQSSRSQSEANLMKFNGIDYNSNRSMMNHRTLIEIKNNYQSNSFLNGEQRWINNSNDDKFNDSDSHLKDLVIELGSFKERLLVKQRKNSILKRVRSLSKINFTKNLNSELLKDEIEYDLNKKRNKKKFFKRGISGIF